MSEAFLVYMLFYIAHFYFSHPACRAQIWFPIQNSMQDQELAQQGIMQNANRILTVFSKSEYAAWLIGQLIFNIWRHTQVVKGGGFEIQ